MSEQGTEPTWVQVTLLKYRDGSCCAKVMTHATNGEGARIARSDDNGHATTEVLNVAIEALEGWAEDEPAV